MTRQCTWQLKMKAQGRCIVCGMPQSTAVYCRFHAQKHSGYVLARYYRNRQSTSTPNSILDADNRSQK